MIHSANEMKRALEERLQQHLDSHQRQVETLKAEISTKEAHISQVSGRYQEQLLAVNLLREELEQTQQHYNVERQKYAKIRAQMKVKEKIRRDLGGLTDTVVSRGMVGKGSSWCGGMRYGVVTRNYVILCSYT